MFIPAPMLKVRIVFLFILFSIVSFAQQVVIEGHADTYKGKTISLYSYQDLITNTPVIIGTDKVNDSGMFKITLPNITNVQYMYLNIDNLNGSIYVTPGTNY